MKKLIIKVFLLLIIAFIYIFYAKFYFVSLAYIKYFMYEKTTILPIPAVEKIYIDDDNYLKIKYSIEKYDSNDIYCLFSTDNNQPSIDDSNWTLSKNNECSTLLEKNKSYYAYLKNQTNKIVPVYGTNTIGKIIDFKINKEKIYVAINGTYQLSATYETIGYIEDNIVWSSDDEFIAKVDNTGKVTGIKKGTTTIRVKIGEEELSVGAIVTNLITVRPKKYNNKKSYLSCGKYSKSDNDLLDEILKDRVADAGYKTRSGPVEAARFLALEFPYKIRYFSENGRGSTNGVDGEGRYYHLGLYLDESRFSSIGKKSNGPKTWGCSLYSRPSHGYRSNGLDCSGFVTWVMLNGGFDVKDVGAGLAPHLDMTDYGKRTKFNADVVKSGKVKVGDLLSSGGVNGGHIAIIVGEDDKYYYVAESLWTPPNVAVVIIGYSKKTIFNRYYYVMLMDSYYKEDGNLTKLWY